MRMPSTYLFIDCETSGLPKGKDGEIDFDAMQIVEVGLVVSDWDAMERRLKTRVAMQVLVKGVTSGAEAQAVHRIAPEELERDGVPPDVAFRMVGEFVIDLLKSKEICDVAICGHNHIAFDLPAIHAKMQRYAPECESIRMEPGVLSCTEFMRYDTRLLMVAWELGERRKAWESIPMFWGRMSGPSKAKSSLPHCLQTLCDPEERASVTAHRAVGDCMATQLVLGAMIRRGIVQEILGIEGPA